MNIATEIKEVGSLLNNKGRTAYMWVSVHNRVFIIFCDWVLYEEEDC